MVYRVIPPPPHLAEYIRFYWVLENATAYVHRAMADGCAEMIFHYSGSFDEITRDNKLEKSFLSGLHGPSKNFRRFSTTTGFGIFGVYLYPFAVPLLFDLPTSEISNQMPDLFSILGKEGQYLEEQMMLAPNNSRRTEIISAFFEKKLTKNESSLSGISSAVHLILQNKGVVNIPVLAEHCCLSIRQFERKFKELAGFSPKLYSRIIRFQCTTEEYGRTDKLLTEIAYDYGYYDQSHFINDFKEFSGYHPGAYFSGDAEGVEWRE